MFHEFASRLVPFCKEQLMNNIVREWCKLANVASPTRIFSIDSISASKSLNRKVVTLQTIHQNDIETALNYYSSGISQWIGTGPSFGIVHRYLVEHPKNNNDLYQGISLVLFCQKDETYQLQQMLTRIRNHWYRKLSRSPLNSGFKSILNEENNTINIVYRPKHLEPNNNDDLPLDDIILNEDGNKQNHVAKQQIDDQRDIIICRTNLDNCLMAFLDDAYTLGDQDRVILKLNPSLVPFKLAIAYEQGTSKSARSRLNEVADYLITNLRDYSDISIFPFVGPTSTLTTDEVDSLAVQYCIILKEDTLKSGLIWLRNRDTQISETIHISNFVKTLLFYLQPEKLINLEEVNQSEAKVKKEK